MNQSIADRKSDDDLHMGSEYLDARSYLARTPRPMPTSLSRRRKAEPQNGSNDSDFAVADQRAD